MYRYSPKENKKYKSYAYATKVFRGELIGDNQEIRSCYKVSQVT